MYNFKMTDSIQSSDFFMTRDQLGQHVRWKRAWHEVSG